MPGAPVEVLRRVPLFADLNKRELAKVARLFKERRFSEGESWSGGFRRRRVP